MEERKRLLPAEKTYSTSLKEPVRIHPIELNTLPPRSVPYMFDEACRQYSSKIALNYKKKGIWKTITYWEYRTMVRNCAKGFIMLGLQPNTVVCILGYNSPEWFVADLGAIYAGGIAAGIYTTNSAEACLYCLNNSNAKIIVVENTQLTKILGIKGKASSLKAIIQYGGEEDKEHHGVLGWNSFMRMGQGVSDSVLETAMKGIHTNQCCTLVYTSGTTGAPKGAMLSHDNVVYDALKIGEKLSLTRNEIYVSYLPLSHVAGNVVDIHCGYMFNVCTYFAEKDALRGSLISTFQEVRPTRILSVPRVWEKIYEKFQERAAESSGLKKYVVNWAKKQGLRKNLCAERNLHGNSPVRYQLANFILFRKCKRLLGIDHCKTIVSGAAPLSLEVKMYFASLDILIHEGYGMSECSAFHSCCLTGSFRFESCGTCCTGMITYIDNPDAESNGEVGQWYNVEDYEKF
ncbi:UNVERIFIED_CONTAM: hypothetical protein PYX00_007598 [Menopon gallinae]|uniref:long-chain-fatty-acid--CoA ligase n=1 Tax=Menopon gallinae TaxID=328185 RepID=A0AAW2HJG7_9NEOP